jgi:hypothetical protein
MFRDVTLSILIAVVLVLFVRVVVWAAAAYPETLPNPETWFSMIGP